MTPADLLALCADLLRLDAEATPGPWSLWTGCSWRRFGCEAIYDDRHGDTVIEPTVAPDGHPDLHFRNGGQDGPDAEIVTRYRNAVPTLARRVPLLLAVMEAARPVLGPDPSGALRFKLRDAIAAYDAATGEKGGA